MSRARLIRRSKLEQRMDILASILKANRDGCGAKPTHVMFYANSSWDVLRKSIVYLQENELIKLEVSNQSQRLFLTPTGLEMLEHYRLLCSAILNDMRSNFSYLEPISQ